MQREIQINQGMISYQRIPEGFFERALVKVTIAPKARPLTDVASVDIIQRDSLPTYRGLEVNGQFSYNTFPFIGRMYGYTYTQEPIIGPRTYWDITTMPSEQQIAQLKFRGRRGVNRWVVGIDNPEILKQLEHIATAE